MSDIGNHHIKPEVAAESFPISSQQTSHQLRLCFLDEDYLPTVESIKEPQVSEEARRVDTDPLVSIYLRRLGARDVAPAGFKAYRYQLNAMLKIAARIRADCIGLLDLMGDVALLGRVLTDDRAPSGSGTVSRWTLAQRRSAIRSFASLMRPELRRALSADPLLRIETSLRFVAERVGTGYRLTGGRPRRRGGYVPSGDEIEAVIKAAAQEPGFRGIRNRAFLEILVATGTRVDALRQLDGTQCLQMPSGRLRIFVHDKGKSEPREVELTMGQSNCLRLYMDAFNQLAAGRHWNVWIGVGLPSPIWKNSSRGRWPYDAVIGMLKQACHESGVPEFSPHALRRAFATDASSQLPRHVVALAGGWQGLERLDDHYIRPRQTSIWKKLYRDSIGEFSRIDESAKDAATLVL